MRTVRKVTRSNLCIIRFPGKSTGPRRKDAVFLQLLGLLAPFGITRYYTDGWGAYERHIDPEQHEVGKEHTQKIESTHIHLRTRLKRLVRRPMCFSKTDDQQNPL